MASESPGATSNPERYFCRIARDFARVEWPDVGRFSLENGRFIRIEKAPNADFATLRAFLLGPVLAIALFQRGFTVLHASAVALRGEDGEWGAVGFLGRSGDGKSTMAAALHARGHRLLCDDVIAVPPFSESVSENADASESASEKVGANSGSEADALTVVRANAGRVPDANIGASASANAGENANAPLIFPALAQLRLWPQSVAALGGAAEVLPLLFPGQERRIWRAARGFEASAVPLRALFLLQSGEQIAVRKLAPARALVRLIEHVYCVESGDLGASALRFQECGAIARAVPIFELERPKDLARLSAVAALVEELWARSQA